jgi:hypothetical protein
MKTPMIHIGYFMRKEDFEITKVIKVFGIIVYRKVYIILPKHP